jgi:signal transduction histidine kinase
MEEMKLNSLSPPESPPSRPRPLRVLLADDSENDAVLLLHALRKAGYDPAHQLVCSASQMKAALQKQNWDLVISDYEMPGFGGLEALELVKASGLDLPFILVSAVLSEETAVTALKAGAHDFIMKRKLARLGPAIERELREAETRAAKKAAESALRQSEEQLRQAQKLEAVARLAAGVAHDFNNILTAIGGHSELLLNQLEPADPRRKNAEQIEKCASMAATLTRQLLTFSRKQPVEPRVVKLNEVVANIERMLRRLIGEDIEFRVSLAEGLAPIKADPGQLEQLVMNLAVNARDAMPRGGKLVISTASLAVDAAGARRLSGLTSLSPGHYVVLAVADTGTGMTDEVKAHLFEPFFTTKPAGKGTGLGLATCFGIVKQSRAHIIVESVLGQGTTFRICFPEAVEPVEPAHDTDVNGQVVGGTETVLLVEDDAAVRELAALTLRARGYTVMEAANGNDAVQLAGQHNGKIDLALTDVVMPILGGKEMAQVLRLSRPAIKILFTSGYTEEVIGELGIARRGLHFLQKPYLPAALVRHVRKVLDSPV